MNTTITPPPLPYADLPPAEAPIPTGLLARLLRLPGSLVVDDTPNLWLRLLLIGALGTTIYGLVIGSFSGGSQLWVAPLKVTVGLIVSVLLCTPSLYVFATLAGARVQARQLLILLTSLLSLAGLLLASLGPVAWIFSQSTESAAFIGFLHWSFWLVSAAFGLRVVSQGLKALGIQYGGAFGLWIIIFLVVCFQMGTTLRPLLGKSTDSSLLTSEKKSFLSHWNETLTEPSH